MKNSTLLIPAFLLLTPKGYAQPQPDKASWQTGITYYYGFIYPHTVKIEYLIQDHVSGFDIFLAKPAISENVYDQLFHYPRIGVGLFHSSLKNPRVLGSVNSVTGFFNAPVCRFSEKSELDYQITAGLAYLTRKFDLYNNNLNEAIGTHLNLHFTAMLNYRVRILKYFEWRGGLSFSHYSNGRVSLPNFGLNYIAVCTGISYNISQTPLMYPAPAIPAFDRFNEHIIIMSSGIKQYMTEDPKHYYIHSLIYDVGRRFRQHLKLSAGTDLFYDASIKTDFEKVKRYGYRYPDLFRIGLHGGFHLTYRKLTMIVMEGYYIWQGYPPPSMFYSRVGLQYRISDHFIVNLSLKSHYAIADFVEWGVGYVFIQK